MLKQHYEINLLGIAFAVSRRKFLHKSVDLLGFTRQSEAIEKLSQRRYKLHISKVKVVDICVHNFLVVPTHIT